MTKSVCVADTYVDQPAPVHAVVADSRLPCDELRRLLSRSLVLLCLHHDIVMYMTVSVWLGRIPSLLRATARAS